MITPEEASYLSSKRTMELNGMHQDPKTGELVSKEQITIPTEHWNRYKKEMGFPDIKTLNETLGEQYENILNRLEYYLDMPEDYRKITALWVIGSYLHKDFETYPYLFFNAMRGSGKSRILKLITALCNGSMMASLTEAVLFRTTGTLAIDEFESLGSKEKQALRELLNACYKKGIKICRMKKKKTMEGEQQVVEEFEPYRPIVMANIWGIEEVLGDRCITLVLEKSNDANFTKLVENFRDDETIKEIIRTFTTIQCSLCSVVSPQNIYIQWNNYIKAKYITTLHTLTTLTTLTPLTTSYDQYLEMFNKIDETNLDGRHLELYLPLFLIAKAIDPQLFEEILSISKKMIHEKRMEEYTESKDILMYNLISKQDEKHYYKVNELVNTFRLMVGDGEHDWLNAKWMGRALKRLNLHIDKRRVGDGIEVTLNIQKAKDKLELFKKQ